MKKVSAYLVSDSTGETVAGVARAALAHFPQVEVESEHLWSFVQTKATLKKLENALIRSPGIVIYTLVDKEIERGLIEICNNLQVLYIPVLNHIIQNLSNYFNIKVDHAKPGKQHRLDEEYFSRVEAVNYALAHDDGQLLDGLERAHIIVLGVSRTSKSPTCLYLAYKGYRVANVPYVRGMELPEKIFSNKKSLIVGLVINARELAQIRRNRILSYGYENNESYIDIEDIESELKESRQFFQYNQIPIIDVTRRSVEETAALILQYYEKKRIRDKREENDS
jgi:hypothetical protein